MRYPASTAPRTNEMICTGALFILISSLAATSFSTAIVHEPRLDCARSSPPPSPLDYLPSNANARRGSEVLKGLEETEELEERQCGTITSYARDVSAAEEESGSVATSQESLESMESDEVTEEQAEEEAQKVGASGAVAESTIAKDLRTVTNYATSIDNYLKAVIKTKKLTIAQGLAIQRQMVTLASSLRHTIKVVKAAHSLTPFESRHLVSSVKQLRDEFVHLLFTTVAAKKVFKTLPFNIVPLVVTALKALSSSTDLLMAELEAIVVGVVKQDVATSRTAIAIAFSKAIAAYSV